MKRLLMVAAMMLAASALAEISLADARGKIGEAVNDAKVMGDLIKELNPSNQVAFLSEVNAAIASMPGSGDERAAKFLEANEAALRNSAKGNLQSLLAETFATVTPDALTVLNERLAADLFNRSADPANPMSDADFTRLAQDTMAVIQERVGQTDDPGVRSTFAILMFVHASNGSPADLADTLVAGLPDANSRELAQNEWIPGALGKDGNAKSYDSMLGASDSEEAPNPGNVAQLAPSRGMEAILADLGSGKTTTQDGMFGLGNLGLPARDTYTSTFDAGTVRVVPLSRDPNAPNFTGGRRGSHKGESRGYDYQRIDILRRR